MINFNHRRHKEWENILERRPRDGGNMQKEMITYPKFSCVKLSELN